MYSNQGKHIQGYSFIGYVDNNKLMWAGDQTKHRKAVYEFFYL